MQISDFSVFILPNFPLSLNLELIRSVQCKNKGTRDASVGRSKYRGEELSFHSAPPTTRIALFWSDDHFSKCDLYVDPHVINVNFCIHPKMEIFKFSFCFTLKSFFEDVLIVANEYRQRIVVQLNVVI